MRSLLEHLKELGFAVHYEYDPMTQLIQYYVMFGNDIVDMGLADEITWNDKLKEICEECKQV